MRSITTIHAQENDRLVTPIPARAHAPVINRADRISSFCLAQFRPEGYGEAAEPNPFALFLELL
jgi:hypothetical protein